MHLWLKSAQLKCRSAAVLLLVQWPRCQATEEQRQRWLCCCANTAPPHHKPTFGHHRLCCDCRGGTH